MRRLRLNINKGNGIMIVGVALIMTMILAVLAFIQITMLTGKSVKMQADTDALADGVAFDRAVSEPVSEKQEAAARYHELMGYINKETGNSYYPLFLSSDIDNHIVTGVLSKDEKLLLNIPGLPYVTMSQRASTRYENNYPKNYVVKLAEMLDRQYTGTPTVDTNNVEEEMVKMFLTAMKRAGRYNGPTAGISLSQIKGLLTGMLKFKCIDHDVSIYNYEMYNPLGLSDSPVLKCGDVVVGDHKLGVYDGKYSFITMTYTEETEQPPEYVEEISERGIPLAPPAPRYSYGQTVPDGVTVRHFYGTAGLMFKWIEAEDGSGGDYYSYTLTKCDEHTDAHELSMIINDTEQIAYIDRSDSNVIVMTNDTGIQTMNTLNVDEYKEGDVIFIFPDKTTDNPRIYRATRDSFHGIRENNSIYMIGEDDDDEPVSIFEGDEGTLRMYEEWTIGGIGLINIAEFEDITRWWEPLPVTYNYKITTEMINAEYYEPAGGNVEAYRPE